MTHVSKLTGKSYEIIPLIDNEGKSYDINLIMYWPTEEEYENNEVFPMVELVNWYFGDYNYDDTEYYIERYIKLNTKPSFVSKHGQEVTDPFKTECLRFEVSDPIKYYGKENVLKMLKEYTER